jgi:hypothetical protein
MFLARFAVMVAGIVAITLVTSSERVRAAISRHTGAGWLFVIVVVANLVMRLRHGGMHLVGRTARTGLLIIVLVPIYYVVFSLLLSLWDWARGRAERRDLARLGQGPPGR